MNDLIIHLGVKGEEENVHVDDFIVVVQTVSTSSPAEVCQ